MTDASDTSLGAVLQQKKDGAWEPLAFYSHKLSPAQKKYSPYNRELLSIYEAIKYFRHKNTQRQVLIQTISTPRLYIPIYYGYQSYFWSRECSSRYLTEGIRAGGCYRFRKIGSSAGRLLATIAKSRHTRYKQRNLL